MNILPKIVLLFQSIFRLSQFLFSYKSFWLCRVESLDRVAKYFLLTSTRGRVCDRINPSQILIHATSLATLLLVTIIVGFVVKTLWTRVNFNKRQLQGLLQPPANEGPAILGDNEHDVIEMQVLWITLAPRDFAPSEMHRLLGSGPDLLWIYMFAPTNLDHKTEKNTWITRLTLISISGFWF